MSSRPKIALLIDWYLPGTNAGGPVRSVHSLVELMKGEFEFYVITRNTDLGSRKGYEGVVSDQLIERNGVFYYYLSRRHLTTERMYRVIRSIAPDLVYLNSFWSFSFSIA